MCKIINNNNEFMRVITEKQPWGYLICSGIKPIENRTWPTNVRGRVLIHTSASMQSPQDVMNSEQLAAANKVAGDICNNELYIKSAIIGSVEIIDCVQNHPSIWAEKGLWHWVLRFPVLFKKPLLGIKGQLGFWERSYEQITCPECREACSCDMAILENRRDTALIDFQHKCEHCGYLITGTWHRRVGITNINKNNTPISL
jgi:hypothetical protein